jgi:hypothetical protein
MLYWVLDPSVAETTGKNFEILIFPGEAPNPSVLKPCPPPPSPTHTHTSRRKRPILAHHQIQLYPPKSSFNWFPQNNRLLRVLYNVVVCEFRMCSQLAMHTRGYGLQFADNSSFHSCSSNANGAPNVSPHMAGNSNATARHTSPSAPVWGDTTTLNASRCTRRNGSLISGWEWDRRNWMWYRRGKIGLWKTYTFIWIFWV